MKIIKEIRLEYTAPDPNGGTEEWTYQARCVIRTNCYGSRLSTFNKLATIAKETYPMLTDDDIEIVHFGGDRYARTYGIEFTPPDGHTVHDGWQQISELERTL
jgi:hypothetical protein